MKNSFFKILFLFSIIVGSLFAVEVFSLPPITDDLKNKAYEYYNNECKACHRWGRKFAAPPMKENVLQYENNPEEMVKYLMHPTPKHPDEWEPMEISPLTENEAKMLTAWLIYILKNPDETQRPK